MATVVKLMAFAEGALSVEPPGSAALHSLLAACRVDSTAPGDIPRRAAGDAAESALYVDWHAGLMQLARLCKERLPAAQKHNYVGLGARPGRYRHRGGHAGES